MGQKSHDDLLFEHSGLLVLSFLNLSLVILAQLWSWEELTEQIIVMFETTQQKGPQQIDGTEMIQGELLQCKMEQLICPGIST